MRRALAGEAAITLDAKDCRTLFGDLRHPDWTDDFIERALVFSVGSDAGMFSESAVAIVALNTRRDLDPAYLDFLNVVGSEIRAGLATLSTNDDRVFATQFRAWRAAQRHAEHVEKTRAEDAIKERDRTNRFIDLLSHEVPGPSTPVLLADPRGQLRNPLGAIVSGVELIGDRLRSIDVTDVEGLRRERDDCLDECATIDYSLAHVQRLLDETLLLSKSENGFLTLSTEAFRPRQLVRDILRIFEVDMRKKDIEGALGRAHPGEKSRRVHSDCFVRRWHRGPRRRVAEVGPRADLADRAHFKELRTSLLAVHSLSTCSATRS
jgi:signal transduction histidine kinase